MRFYCDRKGNWTGRQDDARQMANLDSSGPWKEIDVPTTKEPLLEFLNEYVPAPADVFRIPALAAEAAGDDVDLLEIDDEAMPERIMEMDADRWARIFGACLDRLGELREGAPDALLPHIEPHRHRGALEKALGYLILCNMENRPGELEQRVISIMQKEKRKTMP